MRFVCFIFLSFILYSCGNEQSSTPKPRMYPRIMYPTQSYEPFLLDVCNFTFQKPTYSTVKTGIKFFDEKASHPCWFDLELKDFNGSIHFSYNKINAETELDKLVFDAFRIVEQHNSKAEYRDEIMISNANGVSGLLFNLEGPVASPINFFLTDTLDHFVRASLYFNSSVDPDSIAPILDFVEQDIQQILETFEWKD